MMAGNPPRIVVHQGTRTERIQLTSLAAFSDVIATVSSAGEQAVYDWFLPGHRPVEDVTVDADGCIHLHVFDLSGRHARRPPQGRKANSAPIISSNHIDPNSGAANQLVNSNRFDVSGRIVAGCERFEMRGTTFDLGALLVT